MFPYYDATREHTTLKLMRLQRTGMLDQVEICDALLEEYKRGWRHRETALQIRLSRLPWGLRQIVTRLAIDAEAESPDDSPAKSP